MATLEKAEKEHVERESSVAASVAVQRTVVASNNSSAAASAVGATDIIMIDDDEENDKENVPVPTRNVRRRVGQPRPIPVVDDDVIELSD